jgi:hypothetical protein
MGAAVQCLGEQPLEFRGGQILENRQRRPEFRNVSGIGIARRNPAPEVMYIPLPLAFAKEYSLVSVRFCPIS